MCCVGLSVLCWFECGVLVCCVKCVVLVCCVGLSVLCWFDCVVLV